MTNVIQNNSSVLRSIRFSQKYKGWLDISKKTEENQNQTKPDLNEIVKDKCSIN